MNNNNNKKKKNDWLEWLMLQVQCLLLWQKRQLTTTIIIIIIIIISERRIARVWNLETAVVPVVIVVPLAPFLRINRVWQMKTWIIPVVVGAFVNVVFYSKAQRHCRDRVVTRYVGSGIRSPKLGIKAVRSCRDQRQNPGINTSLDLSREDLKF